MDDLLLKYYKILKDALLYDIETIRNPKKVLLILKAVGAFQNLQQVNRSSGPGGAQHRIPTSHLASTIGRKYKKSPRA